MKKYCVLFFYILFVGLFLLLKPYMLSIEIEEPNIWQLSNSPKIKKDVQAIFVLWNSIEQKDEKSLENVKEKFKKLYEQIKNKFERIDFIDEIENIYPENENFSDQLQKWWVKFEIFDYLDQAQKSTNDENKKEFGQRAYRLVKQKFFPVQDVFEEVDDRYKDDKNFITWVKQQLNPPQELYMAEWNRLYQNFTRYALNKKVQQLQHNLLEQGNTIPSSRSRLLTQLQSINQFSLEVGESQLDCGFFAIYNAKKVQDILSQKDSTTLYTYDMQRPTKSYLGTIPELKSWLSGQRDAIIGIYTKKLSDRIAFIKQLALDKSKKEEYQKAKKILQESYSIDIDISAEVDKKILEYAKRQTTYLSLNDVMKLVESNGLHNTTVIQPLVTDLLAGGEQTLARTFLKMPLQTLVDYGYSDFFTRIQSFRDTGQSQYFIVNPRDHYILAVLNENGMFVIDSEENKNRLDDTNIKILYDFSLLVQLAQQQIALQEDLKKILKVFTKKLDVLGNTLK